MAIKTATCIRFGSRRFVRELEGKLVNSERPSGGSCAVKETSVAGVGTLLNGGFS